MTSKNVYIHSHEMFYFHESFEFSVLARLHVFRELIGAITAPSDEGGHFSQDDPPGRRKLSIASKQFCSHSHKKSSLDNGFEFVAGVRRYTH